MDITGEVAALAEQEKALTRLEEKYSRIQLTKVVEKYGTAKVRHEMENITNELIFYSAS